jgi:hypothetical protein
MALRLHEPPYHRYRRGSIMAFHFRRALSATAVLLLACATLPATAASSNVTKSVSYAILEDYDNHSDLNQVALDFDLMKAAGVDTWRGSIGWDDYEPQRGVYDFGWLQQFAELARSKGIKLRPYIGYTAPWAGNGGSGDGIYWNDPPKRIQDWKNFLTALVSALSAYDNLLSYELYNEVNDSLWWDGNRKQYGNVLIEGAAAIRAARPGVPVLMAGLVFPDYDWINYLCNNAGAGSSFDVAPFHAYPETWSEDGVTVENYLDEQYYDYYAPAIQHDCGNQPIWINETGYATTDGKTEQQQALWWARAFATWLSDAKIAHLGIYEIKDLAPDSEVIGDDANYHLGITRADRTPKLAYGTIGMLIKLLPPGTQTTADGELTIKLKSGATVEPYYHLFKLPDGRQIVFAYDQQGSAKVDIKLKTAGSSARSYSLDGSYASYAAFDGKKLSAVKLVPGSIRIFEVLP